MKKRISFLFLMFALTLGSFSFFSNGKAEAASSGWLTNGGITANVYTDRTGDYPASDTWIGVTGQKTSTGGTVYYEFNLMHHRADGTDEIAGSWQNPETVTGSFSSQSSQRYFYIDDFLPTGSSGIYWVQMKLYSDSGYQNWIGDWNTAWFAVYN
jgi:hypothetical protein